MNVETVQERIQRKEGELADLGDSPAATSFLRGLREQLHDELWDLRRLLRHESSVRST